MMAVDAKFPRALSLSQRARLAFAKSYVARELPGWSRVYRKLIGGYERDDQWTQAPTVRSRNKYFGFESDFDLSSWSGRQSYVLGRWIELPAQLLLYAVKAKTVLDIGSTGKQFTAPELRVALEAVGFRDVSVHNTYAYFSLTTAHKP